MTKYISCEVCDRRKGPLFAMRDKAGNKYYICKECVVKFKDKYGLNDTPK